MPGFLRDLLISFCPERARLALRPESTYRVTACATWAGLAQFIALALLLWLRYRDFFIARSRQWAPYLGGSERVQVTAFIIASLEFFIYPASVLLLYLALEGLTRFAAGLGSSQVVPSLPVFLVFRLKEQWQRRRETERLASLPPDTVEFLSQGRVRIASAHLRPRWNASVTIAIRGEFHEIENREPGMPGRPFVFVLKPATIGRVLRGYQEYDLSAALILNQQGLASGPVNAAAVPAGPSPAEKRPVEN